MELIRFVLDNVLGPVFDHDLAMVRATIKHQASQEVNNQHNDDDDNDDECPSQVSNFGKSLGAGKNNDKLSRGSGCENREGIQVNLANSCMAGDAILDPSGPKLINGFQNWLLFYQLIGHINLPNAPLYLALLYRLLVFLVTNYIMLSHFIYKIIYMRILLLSYSNPIFVLITFLTLIIGFVNNCAIFYTGTFNLCPMYKILETPRLCFVNNYTQQALGSSTLKYMLIYFLYQTILLNLLIHETFSLFIYNFNLIDFLLEYYTLMVMSYSYIGLANLDFYVRSCFGAWLLALATNLECRQARLDWMQRDSSQAHSSSSSSSSPPPSSSSSSSLSSISSIQDAPTMNTLAWGKSIMSKFRQSYLFISLDEIQKSLNTMDDHLEVTRTIQTFSLVLIDLLAFLTSGGLFLIAYNALVKANDIYHGAVFILLSLNFASLVMLTYLGDSFIDYALGKLVQTVEDEYFLQETGQEQGSGQSKFSDTRNGLARKSIIAMNVDSNILESRESWDNLSKEQATMTSKDWLKLPVVGSHLKRQVTPTTTTGAAAAANKTIKLLNDHEQPAGGKSYKQQVDNEQFLSIKRSDVLFCRELLEQFEQHLATPWSKLTFKSHLHMMATFATLIAAQIIFDSH